MSEFQYGPPKVAVKQPEPLFFCFDPVPGVAANENGNGKFRSRARPKTRLALLIRRLFRGERMSVSEMAALAGMSVALLSVVLRLNEAEAHAVALGLRGVVPPSNGNGHSPPSTLKEKLAVLRTEYREDEAILDALVELRNS